MRMALIVSSILSTWPCFTPLELARPKPRISNLPYSFLRPAMAAIFVVPMSSPTIMGCSWFMVWFNLLLFLKFIACIVFIFVFDRKVITTEVLFRNGVFFQWFYFPDFGCICFHFLCHADHFQYIFSCLNRIRP